MGSPMMGSDKVVLPLYEPKKVTGNRLVVDPPMGGLQSKAKRMKTTAKINPFKSIKKTPQVNKLYNTY
jgi:hypothetical protein